MSERRLKRVGALMKAEIGSLIQEGLAGSHETIISVTEVEVAPDLKSARVFVSIYGEEEQKDKTFKRLADSKNLFKNELFRRIRIRHAPEIIFVKDRSLEEGSRISSLLEKLKEERKNNERNQEDS